MRGTHKGGRAPTRGPLPSFFGQETGLQSPKTYGIGDRALLHFQALCLEKGTHKGRPYQLSSRQRRMEFQAIGHYDLHISRRYALRRAPTRGAPTNWLLQALCLEKGTHKGRPYQLSSPGVMP